jgi:hypothetical protein
MKSKSTLDAKKIAKALGAEHRGQVTAKSGHFGAMQLVAGLLCSTPPGKLTSATPRSSPASARATGRPADPQGAAPATSWTPPFSAAPAALRTDPQALGCGSPRTAGLLGVDAGVLVA